MRCTRCNRPLKTAARVIVASRGADLYFGPKCAVKAGLQLTPNRSTENAPAYVDPRQMKLELETT